ncbi:MAG: hypothetical protein GXY83_15590 [Rhodopirellula sp.]|nr:hypothetical protein [Rhodopirellula sp.]
MYAKVFEQIFDSSIADDYEVRHVFMDLLVLADPEGNVDMTVGAISRRTNVPVNIVNRCLQALTSPDPNSRTDKHDGARLVKLRENTEWGWRIVNFEKYHRMRDETARREYMRTYMQNIRAKSRAVNTVLTDVNSCKPQLAHVDVDVDVNVDKEETALAPSRNDVTEHVEVTEASKPKAQPTKTKTPDPITWTPEAGWQGITEADKAEWRKAYPACDIDLCLIQMGVWCKSNPRKAKKSRWRRFISNWLTRQQDRGGTMRSNPSVDTDAAEKRRQAMVDAASAKLAGKDSANGDRHPW